MTRKMQFKISLWFVFLLLHNMLFAQTQKDVLEFKRGRLWHAFHFGQECEPMSDWRRMGFGLDWPGFDPADANIPNLGGSNSYLVSAGFYIMAKNDTGKIIGWDNFATNGKDQKGWVGDDKRYLVKEHRFLYPNGENQWLAVNPREAEETIVTEIEFNGSWYQPWDNQPIPVSIRRVARQWSGSRADQDYIIVEYTIRNMQRRNSLKGVYLLFTYALSPNNRGWNLTFPNLPSGARNTTAYFDSTRHMLVAWAGDFKETPQSDESYDPYTFTRYDALTDKNITRKEFLAPAKMGIRFLYISPDTTGEENHINKFVWSAAPPSQDHSGPFLGVTGLDNKYAAMADPLRLSEAFTDPKDPRMGKNRLYANFSLGPFDIPRRDSIKIVIAEFVGGISYAQAIDPQMTKEKIDVATDSAVQYLAERVQFNFSHHYQVPMPPTPPKFRINAIDSGGVVANVITFSDSVESIPDPHQGQVDIAGYRIYRSWNYPFGPWGKIVEIPLKDPFYYNANNGQYHYVDKNVALGYDYYYAITAYDNGHSSWAVDPSIRIPALESSIFANYSKVPFSTTLRPTRRSLDAVNVVPNPFYRNSGLPKAGLENRIQFVNLSTRCTIRIFTLRGDLVKTIHHDDPNSGVAFWNQVSDNGQLVKSGLYFFTIENEFGDIKRGKLAIIR